MMMGRGWSDASTRPGMPGATRSWRRQGRVFPEKLWKSKALLTPRLSPPFVVVMEAAGTNLARPKY